jgi:hypothetical protein
MSILVILGGLVVIIGGIGAQLAGPVADDFDVTVTSCEAADGSLPTAKVGFTIKNTSSTVQSAIVQIEYRDSAGNRVDTDRAVVRSIAPGDTVSREESTLLDAAPTGALRCAITGVS